MTFISFQLRIILLYALLVLFGVIFGTSMFGMWSIASFSFNLSFIILLLIFFLYSKNYIDLLDFLCLSTLVISLVCVMLNAVVGNISIGFEYLKKWMMFSFTILFFDLERKIYVDISKMFIFVKYMCIILSLLTIYKYFTGGVLNYMRGGILTPDLKLNFENSNKLALFLTSVFFMNMVCFFNEKKFLKKIILLIFAGFMFYFILETNSRTCVMSIFLFVVLLFFFLQYKTSKLSFVVSFFISFLPLLYAEIYLAFNKNPIILDLFSFAESEGKSLDSRERIWNGALDKFYNSPILGAYNELSGGTGVSQCHNTHVDILASYGLISFILFTVFISLILNSVSLKSFEQKMYLSMFIALLCCGFGEAALYSGGMGLSISVGLFLLLAYSNVLPTVKIMKKNK